MPGVPGASPSSGSDSALGALSLTLPQLQPLAQMGPSGRHLVFLNLLTALSSPTPTLAANGPVTTFLMRLPRAPLGQIPLQASQQLRGWASLRVRLGRVGPSPSPAFAALQPAQLLGQKPMQASEPAERGSVVPEDSGTQARPYQHSFFFSTVTVVIILHLVDRYVCRPTVCQD